MTAARRRLRISDVLRDRFTPGVSVLLYLTDRCPVGCAHCSVDARRDSPTITDYPRFAEIVEGICGDQGVRLVGISGGEPFVERRGLTMAMRRLAEAGKDIALYTSGIWARRGEQPGWICELLPLAGCVFLSTDAFHQDALDEQRFSAAARAIATAGVPVIVQVLNTPEEVSEAHRLLAAAFGPGWAEYADLSYIEPLPYGRGEALFERPPSQPAHSVGACALLAAPAIRYDGRISACCHEPVIMGRGPARLSGQAQDAEQTREVLQAIRQDALLGAIASVGAGAVTRHPRFAELADTPVHGICDLCWRLQQAWPEPLGSTDDRVLALLPVLVAADRGGAP